MAAIPWAIVAIFFSPNPAVGNDNLDTSSGPQAELQIGRVIYGQSMSGFDFGRPWWAIDWPEAEAHITDGVSRMSLIDIAPDSKFIQLEDPNLFNYPWLFLQQIGRGGFTAGELNKLREFLLRGGFILVDDFHGSDRAQFDRFARQLFPDRPVVPIPLEDAVMNLHYQLNQSTQIPGSRHLIRLGDGSTGARMEGPQEWLGVYDDNGNLILAAHYNMDMGDAWEHADDPYYPEAMTNLAYRFGVNYMIYAMTH